MKREVQIVDLDGCILMDAWRRCLIQYACPDLDERYDAYHSAAIWDRPANLHEVRTDCRIVILTARPTKYAYQTQAWLREQGIHPHAIIMRNPGDHRHSAELKATQLAWLITIAEYNVQKADIIDAIDDRREVVDLYLNLGIPARMVVAEEKK